ncbi:PAS domain S-box [Candidatus Nitrososphaera evergladensis SR1]|uniref:histidine kinase n=1 Tax=Candidatus Nitrososphaera evergladensis SR1 TaxID=1459636 RepID=A0A075MNY4_9ARCH|nr:ATP-binding protein [Candidatus Nitrososphaera evergladensis]AIF82928.1 PAS domain S-box [Candidatus Nitrososphaera evergladensis SR1]
MHQPVFLSIRSKITFVSLFLAITTLFAVALISFISADNQLRERVSDQLISESTGRGAAIRSLIDTRIEQIRLMSTNSALQNAIAELNQNGSAASSQRMQQYRDDFTAGVESFRQVVGTPAGLENVKVMGIDGRVLFSSDRSEEGADLSHDRRFLRGVNESFLEFDQVNGQRKTIVTVPIYKNGQIGTAPAIGVMMATMDTAKFDEILLNRKGLGETGEVYLVNANRTLISESRFIENAAFRTTVNTLAVNKCFDEGAEIFAVYPDYRNIPIVGSSYCARDLGFVLLAEIDEAEIFQPVTQLRDAILIAGVIITGVVVTIALYVSKTISRPITRLRDAADKITKGDYTHRVGVESGDEIGRLAEQFDMMRKSVLETNMNLNRLVRDRTKELTDMTNALDATAIVAVTDRDGTITKVNSRFAEISKYSEQELIGQNHRILKSGYHPPAFFENMWKTITSGQIWEGEIKNRAKDGSFYWVKTTIVPFLGDDGQPKQYIAIHSDITNLKNTEERLNEALARDRANAEIIKMQVEELNVTNKELRRKDKLKDEFLSMASHELKTPLTPIIGWCDALKSNTILGKLSGEQRAAVDTIEKNAVKLEKMVSDMLDAQKLELNEFKFNIGEVDVDRVIKNVERDLEFVMKENNIEFAVNAQPGLKLRSDETRIIQVLNALLYNSVDFVPKVGGRIELTAEARDGDIVFGVRDNGPGIPKDKQRFLFKKFYQVDTSLKRKHGGTGLGLAISKGIVTGLGGQIWVDTEEGKGSSFYFSLPRETKNENPHN